MPRPKPTAEDLKDRKKRSGVWRRFRRDYLFTQRRLADIVGISRRTIQQIEAGNVTPNPATLRRFAVFQRKHTSSKSKAVERP